MDQYEVIAIHTGPQGPPKITLFGASGPAIEYVLSKEQARRVIQLMQDVAQESLEGTDA